MDAPASPTRLPLRTALLSILALWAFYFVLTTVRATVLEFDDPLGMFYRRTAVTLIGMLLTFGLYLVILPAARASLRFRIVAAFVASLPFATLFSAINYTAFYVLYPIEINLDGNDPASPPKEEKDRESDLTPTMMIADGAVTWYFMFVAWSALHLALGYAAEAVAAERRAADAHADAQAAELRALRYQVNPHFLFNTLNSLSSLVLTAQAEKAERMIINLSTFFRTSLSAEPTEDVVLAEEIRLQRLYLDIEQVRFPDRLHVTFAIPDGLAGACVPGLILQPLIENAIKYGVSRARAPVSLHVSAAERAGRLVLRVADDGVTVPGAPDVEGHGVGLANVRSRLKARFGDAAEARWGPVVPHGFAVELVMPLMRHGC